MSHTAGTNALANAEHSARLVLISLRNTVLFEGFVE